MNIKELEVEEAEEIELSAYTHTTAIVSKVTKWEVDDNQYYVLIGGTIEKFNYVLLDKEKRLLNCITFSPTEQDFIRLITLTSSQVVELLISCIDK